MQQDYSILVDKKDNDYWTTTLKRFRKCTCRHTHDTFKNYHILNNKMYKEREQENKKDVKANHYYCDTQITKQCTT